jgi:hypothetical protein
MSDGDKVASLGLVPKQEEIVEEDNNTKGE